MKKLFILFAISSLGFVACNNASEGEGNSDTTVVDPTLGNPPVNPTDTMVNLDTTSAATDTSAIKL
ncbi:hypothetical protein U0035_20960 [Niabella yanshanensis]|uniref:Entericidin n=1 Tax=Niabella yanshanensis TaxID=577386 RepID=A0ABZ0W6M8_9BACT|nr:hypothetical protein [Niabella yanshanensis]WQD38142.1 hypothetical protein U0035_20960 [Niabella yanshanensis]